MKLVREDLNDYFHETLLRQAVTTADDLIKHARKYWCSNIC